MQSPLVEKKCYHDINPYFLIFKQLHIKSNRLLTI
jgi:hypothetical protein